MNERDREPFVKYGHVMSRFIFTGLGILLALNGAQNAEHNLLAGGAEVTAGLISGYYGIRGNLSNPFRRGQR